MGSSISSLVDHSIDKILLANDDLYEVLQELLKKGIVDITIEAIHYVSNNRSPEISIYCSIDYVLKLVSAMKDFNAFVANTSHPNGIAVKFDPSSIKTIPPNTASYKMYSWDTHDKFYLAEIPTELTRYKNFGLGLDEEEVMELATKKVFQKHYTNKYNGICDGYYLSISVVDAIKIIEKFKPELRGKLITQSIRQKIECNAYRLKENTVLMKRMNEWIGQISPDVIDADMFAVFEPKTVKINKSGTVEFENILHDIYANYKKCNDSHSLYRFIKNLIEITKHDGTVVIHIHSIDNTPRRINIGIPTIDILQESERIESLESYNKSFDQSTLPLGTKIITQKLPTQCIYRCPERIMTCILEIPTKTAISLANEGSATNGNDSYMIMSSIDALESVKKVLPIIIERVQHHEFIEHFCRNIHKIEDLKTKETEFLTFFETLNFD